MGRLPPVRIHVRYFADAREAAARDEEELVLQAPATVADALKALTRLHPPLEAVAKQARVALDESFVTEAAALHDGATLVLIPPVGGG